MQSIESSFEQSYQDRNCILSVFVQQSENCELIIGKASLTPKRQIQSQIFHISLKGYYIITKLQQSQAKEKDNREDSEYSINLQNSQIQKENKIQTFQNFSVFSTGRNKHLQTEQYLHNSKQVIKDLESQSNNRKITCFLEGQQKVSQLQFKQNFQPWQVYIYPFTFTLPSNLPPTLDDIYFGGYHIKIKYEIEIVNSEKSKDLTIAYKFPLHLRGPRRQLNQTFKTNAMKMKCFRLICNCQGDYHFEFESTVLAPGKIRIYTRIFKEGGTAKPIVRNIKIKFYAEMKDVKKLLLEQKDIKVNQNQFQMLQGEAILTYQKSLRTFDNQLFTIRFWLQPKIELIPNIWVLSKKSINTDIII